MLNIAILALMWLVTCGSFGFHFKISFFHKEDKEIVFPQLWNF